MTMSIDLTSQSFFKIIFPYLIEYIIIIISFLHLHFVATLPSTTCPASHDPNPVGMLILISDIFLAF